MLWMEAQRDVPAVVGIKPSLMGKRHAALFQTAPQD
jgi:hypothetical protein